MNVVLQYPTLSMFLLIQLRTYPSIILSNFVSMIFQQTAEHFGDRKQTLIYMGSAVLESKNEHSVDGNNF